MKPSGVTCSLWAVIPTSCDAVSQASAPGACSYVFRATFKCPSVRLHRDRENGPHTHASADCNWTYNSAVMLAHHWHLCPFSGMWTPRGHHVHGYTTWHFLLFTELDNRRKERQQEATHNISFISMTCTAFHALSLK